MLKIVAATAVASMLIASPALAQDAGFYVGADLGAAFATDFDATFTPGGTVEPDFELGYAGSAFAGYDFGAFRVEAETFTVSADIDELTSSFALPGGVTGSQSAEGDVTAQGYFANAIVDFGGSDDFSFFVGAGAGQASIEATEIPTSTGSTALDDEDEQFAWQAFAGVRKSLTSRLDGHIRYRYLSVDDVEMNGFGGRTVEGKFVSHSLSLGVAYRF